MNTEKKIAVTSPQRSVLAFIEIGVLLILTLLKSYYFYRFIGAEDYSAALAFATTGILLFVFTAFMFYRRFSPIAPVVTVYSLMCLLMFADRLFASYFKGSLPRIVSLTLLGQATGVGDSITALFDISHFLYVIDLLFIYVYLFFRKRIASFLQYEIKHFFRYCVSAVCILLCGTVFTSYYFIGRNGGYMGALKNEVFIYHGSDLINTLFPDDSGSDADPFDYIGKTNYESEYRGIGEGRNLINIQVEALNEYPIGLTYNGQEITPNLNKLLGNDTLYFDNYYWCNIGGGGTSDAEFMVHNSLYPPSNESAYMKYSENAFYGLPYLLKDNGYTGAYVFHGYKNKEYWNRSATYPGQGFDDFINGTDDFVNTETIGLGISDRQFFEQSVEYMVTYEQPFYAFLITLTSHHPYEMPPEFCMLELESQHQDTMFGDYLQSIRYAYEQLGMFLELLKENGLYDNSVITIYGDHYGLNHKYDGGFTSEVMGEEYTKEEIYKVPLFIHVPDSGISETISTTGSHMDYTPTILSVMGIKNNRSIMFGQNLLAEDTVGKVFGQNHMSIGGFITDELYGEFTATGLKVYDKVTNEPLDPEPYTYLHEEAKETMEKAHYLLDTNQIRLENFE
ncbi:MAG: LTA synthase family protein [Clostridia bacterium]|nr:LTA synthase family protein [Clostridia bacterium]